MKEIIKEIDNNKMILTVSKEAYEKDAIFNASYNFTEKCFLKIDVQDDYYEIIFETKNEFTNLKDIALSFANELIDQQVRLVCHREHKIIRETIVKKAFKSIENK